MINKVSDTGASLIKHFEQCRLAPYLDGVNVATIGWGNTFYPGGKKVTMNDKPISQVYADTMFKTVLSKFAQDVVHLITVSKTTGLHQHQFDSLVSLAYNIGVGAFGKSTLLRKVNANPDDPEIVAEFLRWNKAGGKMLPGLTRRRTVEAHYYITGNLKLT